MSRTVARARALAQISLHQRNPSFKVLSVEDGDYGFRRYIIELPLTAAYLGMSGPPILPLYLRTRLTKFGRSLDRQLAAIEGCSTVFSETLPTVLTLDTTSMPFEISDYVLSAQVKSLPASICLAIQTAIEQHNTPQRRFLEIIRRVI
jgi:hypothetical protein